MNQLQALALAQELVAELKALRIELERLRKIVERIEERETGGAET